MGNVELGDGGWRALGWIPGSPPGTALNASHAKALRLSPHVGKNMENRW